MPISRPGKLLKRIILAVAVIIFGACVLNYAARYRDFRHGLIGFGGINLGDSRDEVTYRAGTPTQVIGPEETIQGWRLCPVYNTDDNAPGFKIPKGKRVKEFAEWEYTGPNYKAGLHVKFDPQGLVKSIRWFPVPEKPVHWGPVAGISCADVEEKVLGLGPPTSMSIEKDTYTKTIEYSDIGVSFILERGKVYQVEITSPKRGTWAAFRRFLRTLP